MLSKALALTSVAALAGQSLALHAHRGLHAEKRAVKIVVETVWSTVYVTTDCDEASSTVHPKLSPSVNLMPTTTAQATSTVTSTSTVTIASSTASSSSSSQAPSQAPPSSKQTTQAPPSSSSAVSTPDVSTPAPPTSSAHPPPQSSTSKAPAPPSSTSAASSASQPAPSAMAAPGGSKRGIAYNDPNLANTFRQHCANCGTAYNWGADPSGLDPSTDYVPMLWGPGSDHSSTWDSSANAALNRGCKNFLSFNEPDNAGQSNLSPAAAASAHAQYMNKYAGQARIGSPAITNSGDPNQGVGWLQQFMSACSSQPGGCQIDFCAIHWYSPCDQEESLYDHIEKAHAACGGKPIWLTEFAPFGTPDQIKTFLASAIPKLEANPYLEKYFYFMVDTTSLMTDASTLSEYGQFYASS